MPRFTTCNGYANDSDLWPRFLLVERIGRLKVESTKAETRTEQELTEEGGRLIATYISLGVSKLAERDNWVS